ncbi:MAG TPA: bifunctional phosphoserine phosphatase/homoserine phosphotransferase ThrH [Gammaproteobacteria bacterium]|nr:bifunctional phosphoserine phosphatase/homoserine phosphotransferase ThrH [Gammaproteobacteria bacterium]
MHIACLDFEGVLVPEIWVGLAERTGVEALKATTRDIPDYDELMQMRLRTMDERGLRFADVRAAAEALDPLPGAREFLDWLRGEYQVAIVSDTFYELAMPLVKKLGLPTMLCHRLNVDADGRLSGYRLRQPDPKRNAVRGFKSMQYKVVATGDSYNDVPMLEEADLSWFFQPPENVVRDYPRIPIARSYAELKAAFTAAKSTLA